MSTTVKYKGATLATVSNQTKTLLTSGTWLEDDIELTDVTAGGVGELLNTTSLGSINTSSTTAASVANVSVSDINTYDLLIVDCSVNTETNNRHTSTVSVVFLTGSSNAATTKNGNVIATAKWNSKKNSSGTHLSYQSTTAYGIYVNSCSISSGTATLGIYRRYNSTQTGTINGTYTCRTYGVKLIDLIGG